MTVWSRPFAASYVQCKNTSTAHSPKNITSTPSFRLISQEQSAWETWQGAAVFLWRFWLAQQKDSLWLSIRRKRILCTFEAAPENGHSLINETWTSIFCQEKQQKYTEIASKNLRLRLQIATFCHFQNTKLLPSSTSVRSQKRPMVPAHLELRFPRSSSALRNIGHYDCAENFRPPKLPSVETSQKSISAHQDVTNKTGVSFLLAFLLASQLLVPKWQWRTLVAWKMLLAFWSILLMIIGKKQLGVNNHRVYFLWFLRPGNPFAHGLKKNINELNRYGEWF